MGVRHLKLVSNYYNFTGLLLFVLATPVALGQTLAAQKMVAQREKIEQGGLATGSFSIVGTWRLVEGSDEEEHVEWDFKFTEESGQLGGVVVMRSTKKETPLRSVNFDGKTLIVRFRLETPRGLAELPDLVMKLSGNYLKVI